MSEKPVSFLDALRARYGAEDDTGNYAAEDFLVGGTSSKSNKKWEMVGMDLARRQQSRYDRLVVVVLKSEGLTCALRPEEEQEQSDGLDALAAQRMTRLQELDLSDNPNLPLEETGRLVSYFPKLTVLQLSDAPQLLPPPALDTAALLSSPHLSKLVLNNINFDNFSDLAALLALPELRELHLDSNHIRTLRLTADSESDITAAATANPNLQVFSSVKTLSLAHNAIEDWTQLGQVLHAVFPALTELYLTDNQLHSDTLPPPSSVDTAEGDESSNAADNNGLAHCLGQLTLLCLKDNEHLTDPNMLERIRLYCPELRVFRITYGHLLPSWNETLSRMYTVASLPTITVLNRGDVRKKERLDSEIFYIQRGLAAKPSDDAASAAAATAAADPLAPRYPMLAALQEKHHDVIVSIYKEGATATHDGTGSQLLVKVTLRVTNAYTTGSAAATEGTAVKELPTSLTVEKLKSIVRMMFQVDVPNQRLAVRSGDAGVLSEPVPLDNEQQTLGYFGVSNGSIIEITDISLR